MAELTADDLPAAVLARFADDDAAQSAVDASLAAARRLCGWPVSPVRTETIVVDGPGGRLLSLPTLRLIELTELSENGAPVDVDTLDVSRRMGTVQKYPCGYWTNRAGGIEVTMTHGFTEIEAADWRQAVLSFVDRISLGSGSDQPIMVGPFRWSDTSGLSFSAAERTLLDRYRLLEFP